MPIDLKTLTPDTSLPTTGFLFGADSQSASSPSVYSTQTVATTLLGSTSLSGATVTASAPLLDLSQTWNNAAVTFTGLKFNAAGSSNTNSAAGSLLFDLQMEGTSVVSVGKTTLRGPSGSVIAGSGPGITFQGNTSTGFGANSQNLAIWVGGVIGLNLTDRSGGGQFRVPSDYQYSWASATNNNAAADTILTRRAAANLRLGAADAASPVAQTLSVQSVSAGQTNVAGADLTITGSQGTGSGAGGSIVFQVAPAGASGTAQNALVTRASLNPQGVFELPVQDSPLYLSATFPKIRANTLALSTTGLLSNTYLYAAPNSLYIGSANSNAVRFEVDAANTLALRNGTNAQTFNVYNTYTSDTNFERLRIVAQSGGNVIIGTQKGSGGGTARGLEFQTDGAARLTIGTDGNTTALGNFITTSNFWLATNGTSSRFAFGASADACFFREDAAVIGVRGTSSSAGGALSFIEQTAPAAPATNGVRIYAEDDGTGKTRLMARFATGAAVQIAIEP